MPTKEKSYINVKMNTSSNTTMTRSESVNNTTRSESATNMTRSESRTLNNNTIALWFTPFGRNPVVERQILGTDGYTTMIKVNEFNFCKNNIMWVVKKSQSDNAGANAIYHDFRACKFTHFTSFKFNNKNLCGSSIGGLPCNFGTKCNLIHPLNYPQILDNSVSEEDENKKKLMCWKQLMKDYKVALPFGEVECNGNCNFAHTIEEQYIPSSAKILKNRIESNTLDMQKIVDEIVRVLTLSSDETKKKIFSKTDNNSFPPLSSTCVDKWLTCWFNGASLIRKEKKYGNNNADILTLFPDIKGEEDIVYEICRCMKSCSASYDMQVKRITGKNVLCSPYENKNDCTPICRGGRQCKFGVHLTDVDNNGNLNIIDIDNLNGKSSMIIPDLIIKRKNIRTNIDELLSTRVEKIQELAKLDAKESNDHDTRMSKNTITSQLSDLNKQIDEECETYVNMFNSIKLIPNGTSITVSLPKITSISNIPNENVFPPLEQSCASPRTLSPEEIETKKRNAIEKAEKALVKENNDVVLRECVSKFRNYREKKIAEIANASTLDEARTLYSDFLNDTNKCFVRVNQKNYDPKTLKKMTTTIDNRPIFFTSDNDDTVRVCNQFGTLIKCATGSVLTSKDFETMVKSFDHDTFKTFYSTGAYTAVSYDSYRKYSIVREAWTHYLVNNNQYKDWDAFYNAVREKNLYWKNMDVEKKSLISALRSGLWNNKTKSVEGAKDGLVHHDIITTCQEKQVYDNFWGFFFKKPIISDEKIVGDDGDLARKETHLFDQFLATKSTLTFTEWLAGDNTDSNAPIASPNIRVAYDVYKSKIFKNASWLTIYTYVNYVRPHNISFDTFIADEVNYTEYYKQGKNTLNISFSDFVESKKSGWELSNGPKTNTLDSLLDLSENMIKSAASFIAKISPWTITNLIEFGELPSKTFPIMVGKSVYSVQSTIADDTIYKLINALSNKTTSIDTIKSLMKEIPTTYEDSLKLRDIMCNNYKEQMEVSINNSRDSFIENISNSKIDTVFMNNLYESITSNSNSSESSIHYIRRIIDKKTTIQQRMELNKLFDTFLRMAKTSISSNIKIIKNNISLIEYTQETMPTLLKYAEKRINFPADCITPSASPIPPSASPSPILTSKPTVISKIKVTETARTRYDSINSIGEMLPCAFDGMELLKGGESSSPVQRKSRFPHKLDDHTKFYCTNEKITAKNGTTESEVTVIGPFEAKNDTVMKQIRTALNKKLGCSVSIINFINSKDEETYELAIYTGSEKIEKKAEKYGDNHGFRMKPIYDKMQQMLKIIANITQIDEMQIHSPTLDMHSPRSSPVNRTSPIRRSNDVEEDSDDDSSDDDIEITNKFSMKK